MGLVALVALLILTSSGTRGSLAEESGAFSTPVESAPLPTEVPSEPAPTLVAPSPIPTEAVTPPAPLPTEAPTATEPAPTATSASTPDSQPSPTEAAPTSTVAPITDTVLLSGANDVVLAEGTEYTFTLVYAVTTERESTEIRAWLNGDTASSWQLRLAESSQPTVANSVSLVDDVAVSPGTTVEMAITIIAPTDISEAQTVTLHASGTVLLSDGTPINGAPDSDALATISVTPAVESGDQEPPIMPLVVSNNGMTCTQIAPHVVRPGASISFGCQGVIGGTYRVTATTSGWLVSIGNGTPASMVTTTLDGSSGSTFVVNIHAPSGATHGATETVQVARTDVTGATSSITVSVVTITNQGGAITNKMTCTDANPNSLVIAPGGTLTFRCTIEGLAGLKVLGLSVLSLNLSASSSPVDWTLGSNLSGTGTGAINVAVGTSTALDLLIADGITFTVTVPCVTQSGTVTVQSSFNVLALVRVDRTSTIPITIDPTQVAPPAITAVGTAAFPASAWNGTSYPIVTSGLTITVGSPAAGCLGNWQLMVSGTSLTRSGGGGNIPIGNLSYTGGIASSGISPGPAVPIDLTSGPIASGTSSVLPGSTVTISLSLAPPASAPAGTYGGDLTFTAALGPN